jgi:hypothetical protein
MLNMYLELIVTFIVLPVSILPYARRNSLKFPNSKTLMTSIKYSYPRKDEHDTPVIDILYCEWFHNLGHALSVIAIIIVVPLLIEKILAWKASTIFILASFFTIILYMYGYLGTKNMLFSRLVITQHFLYWIGPYRFKKWNTANRSDIESAFYITQGSGVLFVKLRGHFLMPFVGVSNGFEICKLLNIDK